MPLYRATKDQLGPNRRRHFVVVGGYKGEEDGVKMKEIKPLQYRREGAATMIGVTATEPSISDSDCEAAASVTIAKEL